MLSYEMGLSFNGTPGYVMIKSEEEVEGVIKLIDLICDGRMLFLNRKV